MIVVVLSADFDLGMAEDGCGAGGASRTVHRVSTGKTGADADCDPKVAAPLGPALKIDDVEVGASVSALVEELVVTVEPINFGSPELMMLVKFAVPARLTIVPRDSEVVVSIAGDGMRLARTSLRVISVLWLFELGLVISAQETAPRPIRMRKGFISSTLQMAT